MGDLVKRRRMGLKRRPPLGGARGPECWRVTREVIVLGFLNTSKDGSLVVAVCLKLK
jgi:hypothetical protein